MLAAARELGLREVRFLDYPDGALDTVDTAEARELIQTTVIEDNLVGLRASGDRVYQRVLETGAQIWVYVREGTIRNAGCNEAGRSGDAGVPREMLF